MTRNRFRRSAAEWLGTIIVVLGTVLVGSSRNVWALRNSDSRKAVAAEMSELRAAGVDEVSMTEDAARLRDLHLRKKKMKGIIRKRSVSLANVLFPGASPEIYGEGEAVPMYVEQVDSRKTHIPFGFYDLPVCGKPDGIKVKSFRKNIGARLQGLSVEPSFYEIETKVSHGCKRACIKTFTGPTMKKMRRIVERQYRVNLSLDSLPVLMKNKELNYAVRGYPVGFKAPPEFTGLQTDEYYLYNHLKFTISYNELSTDTDKIHITGFEVHPVSIEHKFDGEVYNTNTEVTTCTDEVNVVNNLKTYQPLRVGPAGEEVRIIYSYEVEWLESKVLWADRWDIYLIGAPDDDIHFFAIANSFMIVLFLVGAVGTILIRGVRKDIAVYNELQTLEEAQEETGWKLVHGDVFRPPSTQPILLCVVVGTGVQIGLACLLTLTCAMLHLLNPIKKGQALTSIIIIFVLCGSAGGYTSSRIYKFFGAKDWKKNTVLTAAAFPGILFTMFTILNVFLHFVHAASSVSFWTVLCLFLLWVCVSTPLVFIGSYFGFRLGKIEVPTKTNQISRIVPPQPIYSTLVWSTVLAGMLPFGSVFIELFFIMSALWLHQIYYVMGFLLAVLLILAATSSMVSIVACYLQLCSEDHRWWWRSFFNCASAGIYVFLYALWFLMSKLDLVGFLPVVVYLTYMIMISVAFSVFCGSIGVISCFWFTKTIYGAVKVD